MKTRSSITFILLAISLSAYTHLSFMNKRYQIFKLCWLIISIIKHLIIYRPIHLIHSCRSTHVFIDRITHLKRLQAITQFLSLLILLLQLVRFSNFQNFGKAYCTFYHHQFHIQ